MLCLFKLVTRLARSRTSLVKDRAMSYLVTIMTKGPVDLMKSPRKQKLFSIIGFLLGFFTTTHLHHQNLKYSTCVPGDHGDHSDHGTIGLYDYSVTLGPLFFILSC